MNLEIPNDISQKNIFEYQKDSNDNSIIYSCDMKRKLLGRKTKRNYSDITEIERIRCDICLEFEKYSENNLIECKKCGGICHKRCGENDLCFIDNLNSSETPQNQIKDEEWKCLHCRNLNSSALSYSHSIFIQTSKLRKWRKKNICTICKSRENENRCVIKCANTKCKFYAHIPCAVLRNMIIPLDFMTDYYGFSTDDRKTKPIPFYCNLHNRNLIDEYTNYVYQLDQVISETIFNTGTVKYFKKAESNSPIRVKSEKENNPAGNSYFTKDIKTEEDTVECEGEIFDSSNFYNKNEQIKTDNINTLDHQHNDNSIDDNFQNIMSLQLNFEKNILETAYDNLSVRSLPINEECNPKDASMNFFNQINKIVPQKPKYQHDDSIAFNLNLPNLFPNSEYNFINIENNNNFNLNFDKEFDNMFLEKIKMENLSSLNISPSNFDKFSKMFYDYFETDINLMKEEDKSKITITQIKQLKKFLIKIIKNYKNCDKDISIIYEILKKEGIFKE